LVRTDEPVALPAAWSQVKALLSDDQVRFVTVEDGVSDYALRCGADLDDEDDQDGGGAGNDDSAAWYYYSLGYHHRIGHSCEPGFLGRRTRHPPAGRERVFDRFTRLDDARSRDAGGAGLGLAIALSIATRHGGSIHVAESTPGALLTVRLPAAVPAHHHGDPDQGDRGPCAPAHPPAG
jgi:hypothetical protein